MAGGYWGVTLDIDLTQRRTARMDIDRKILEQYIGGRGLGVRLLWERIQTNGVDAFAPENPLLFCPGPLSSLPLPGPSRVSVVTKAANTPTLTYSSIGGHFGPALKKTGHDALSLVGKSDRPVVLVIDDGKVTFREASGLWGQSAVATLARLNRELGPDFSCLAIGPAGEQLVRFAGIVSDVRRTGARGGAGAVMGSKKVKAIAVRGTRNLPVHDLEGLVRLGSDTRTLLAQWNGFSHWRRWGATPLLLSANKAGLLATRNFREGSWPDVERLGAPVAEKEFWVRSSACAGCPVGCVKTGQISNGPWRGTIADGPGFSAGAMLGSNCGVSDFGGMMKLIARSDELGFDPIAIGNVLGFAMDLYADGILSSADFGGLTPAWGNVPAMLRLMDDIVAKQNAGSFLSEGVKRAAKSLGKAAEPYAMHIKGQEMAGWNIPAQPDFAIVQGTSNRGASHQEGSSAAEQNRRTFLDSVCVCRFLYGGAGIAPYQRAVSLATGWTMDDTAAQTIGERVWNLEKCFNVREGLRRDEDRIPARLLDYPLPTGPKAGAVFTTAQQDAALDSYYRSRGWDEKTSLPKPEKLRSLGLDTLVKL